MLTDQPLQLLELDLRLGAVSHRVTQHGYFHDVPGRIDAWVDFLQSRCRSFGFLRTAFQAIIEVEERLPYRIREANCGVVNERNLPHPIPSAFLTRMCLVFPLRAVDTCNS